MRGQGIQNGVDLAWLEALELGPPNSSGGWKCGGGAPEGFGG